MSEQSRLTKPIAVLIDAENVQLSALPDVLTKCEQLGSVALRRAYGDFTLANLKDWSKAASDLSIHPIQQFRIINGKSVSDSALIIDAMDLLHSGRYGAFCIVTSDSDFTRLGTRIREDGLSVFGFGEGKTHEAFVSACNQFFDTKKLRTEASMKATKQVSALGRTAPPKEVLDRLAQVIAAAGGTTLNVPLAAFGQQLKKEFPEFKLKKYGYATWGKFFPNFPKVFKFSTTDGTSYVKLP